MKLYLESYGCTLSKSETAMYVNTMISQGWELTEKPEDADMSIIGTCVVIKSTEERMIQRIGEISRHSRVRVLGCLSSVGGDALETEGVEVVKPSEFRSFYGGRIDDVEVSEPSIWEGIPINQGCLGSCNFCISRVARGRLVSRTSQKIVNQVRMQLSRNVREVKITSLDTAAYGRDIGSSLTELVRSILEINDHFMLRIGMMEPKNAKILIPDLFSAMSDRRVYKFLHIPVQSGSDRILEDMNREYTRDDFISIAEAYRQYHHEGSLSTDVIVGYRGEDEESFESTFSLMERVKPDIMNITRFSPRPYTRDFGSSTPSSNRIKKWTSALSDLHRKIAEEKLSKFVGRIETGMAVEHGKGETTVLRDANYRPVVVPGRLDIYSTVNVEIVDASSTYLIGKIVS